MTVKNRPKKRGKKVVSYHYDLEVREGDAIIKTLPTFSELDRDLAWAQDHNWHFTYWPDGTKTVDFPNGRLRLPMIGAA